MWMLRDRYGVSLGIAAILGYGADANIGARGKGGGKKDGPATKQDLQKALDGASPQQLADVEAALGLNFGGSMKSEDRAVRIADSMMAMAHQVCSATGDKSFSSGAITSAATSLIDLNARESAGESRRLTDNSGYTRSAQDVQQKQEAYKAAESRSDSAGISQQIPLQNFANGLVNNPEAFAAAVNAAMSPESGGRTKRSRLPTTKCWARFLEKREHGKGGSSGLGIVGTSIAAGWSWRCC